MRILLLLLTLSMGIQAQANETVCIRQILEIAQDAHIEYPDHFYDELEIVKHQIRPAAERLGMKSKDFVNRLHELEYSPIEFFEQVEAYKNIKKQTFREKIASLKDINYLELGEGIRNITPQNAKRKVQELVYKIKRQIDGRKIQNMNFFRDFLIYFVANEVNMAIVHVGTIGMKDFHILATQLTALMITDIGLTFGTAKHAAYLVAEPDILKKLNQIDGEQLTKRENKFLVFMKSLISATGQAVKKKSALAYDVIKNTANNAPYMAKMSLAAGIIPMAIGATLESATLTEAAMKTLVFTGFHVGFIALWANFRTQLIFVKALPALSNSSMSETISNSKFLPSIKMGKYKLNTGVLVNKGVEFAIVGGIIGLNMTIASYTYGQGSEYLRDKYFPEEKKDEEIEILEDIATAVAAY